MRLIDADELSKWISGQSKSPSCPKNESAFGLRIIKHIDRMPSVQPVDKDINVSCKDAISRQAVKEMMCIKHCTSFHTCEQKYGCYKTHDLELLPSVQPEPHWIPVTERLPEPRTDVWVNSDIGQIQGYYEENVKIWYASFGQGRDYLELIVNAWMPLPEPYLEEGE